MDARGTCDGRHRARKHCPDPECYLKSEPLAEGQDDAGAETPPSHDLPPITDADNLAGELPWCPEDHGGQGQPSDEYADPRHEPVALDALPVFGPGHEAQREQTQEEAQRWLDEARSALDRLASEPIEFGPGIFRWACSRDGGYQRTEYAHELPPCPAGWRWSSAQVTAVGGRGKLHVSAAVVDGSEGANAPTGPQSLVLEITGRGGYCTGLDVVLFARPAEVQR